MEVYIEYAFIENFLFDGTLLFLSLKATKVPVYWGKLIFSSVLGAVFAVVFPLLILPSGLGYLLKFSVAFLLVLLVSGRLKTKKEWGRYALNVTFFFLFSFGFGGALTAFFDISGKEKVSNGYVILLFALLALFSVPLIKKLYARKALHRFIYPCFISKGGKRVKSSGFLDSGNFAFKDGIPVCFVSPEIVYELWGKDICFGDIEKEKGTGQVCDEMRIRTVNGERRVPLYKAALEIKTDGGIHKIKDVYFAPSANMLSREYKILLNSGIFE